MKKTWKIRKGECPEELDDEITDFVRDFLDKYIYISDERTWKCKDTCELSISIEKVKGGK